MDLKYLLRLKGTYLRLFLDISSCKQLDPEGQLTSLNHCLLQTLYRGECKGYSNFCFSSGICPKVPLMWCPR